MDTEIVYEDMPERIKALAVKNKDGIDTIIINNKWNKGSDKEAIIKLLSDERLSVR